MTPLLWKFTQELASLTRINDIDKEKINCVSIHAIANAAINHFNLADPKKYQTADSNDKGRSISAEPKDYGQINEVVDSDKDHFTSAEPEDYGQRNEVVDSNKDHFTSAELEDHDQRNEMADSNGKDHSTSAGLEDHIQRNGVADSNDKEQFTSAGLEDHKTMTKENGVTDSDDKDHFTSATLEDYGQINGEVDFDDDHFTSTGLEDYGQRNEMADSNNKSDGLETRKHPSLQDEELISIKKRKVGMKSSNTVVKPVIKNKYVLEWNFEEDTRPPISLNIPLDIQKKVFKQMKDMYSKQNLPDVISELCRQCAKIARENTRMDLEDSIEDVYDDLKKSSADKPLLRTCQKVWGHM
ncbi:8766_t:CDS:2 [Dentiscutata erythropus]|uniref:8766_t:CDS:1 n=1 Tax=Dentiscutata erythropus TaxID=1348616 RepID=A0A9N9NFP8_9GLOM|nr:8766_t:CDS:2 [Dentiscutata erythropus]